MFNSFCSSNIAAYILIMISKISCMKKVSLIVSILALTLGCKQQAITETLPEPPPKKIATWGDSFTFGGGVTMVEYAYPDQLQKISGYEVYNGGVNGETSTQIKKRMLAATDKKNHYVIIWAGDNNFRSPEIVKADIAEMVASLGHKRYLVISLLGSKYERTGSVGYTTIMDLNAHLKQTYKENYLDVRSYLVSQASTSAQDQQDKAIDIVPTSLRSDDEHPNDKGYNLIAAFIYKNFTALH
jgi:hypothetical protein